MTDWIPARVISRPKSRVPFDKLLRRLGGPPPVNADDDEFDADGRLLQPPPEPAAVVPRYSPKGRELLAFFERVLARG